VARGTRAGCKDCGVMLSGGGPVVGSLLDRIKEGGGVGIANEIPISLDDDGSLQACGVQLNAKYVIVEENHCPQKACSYPSRTHALIRTSQNPSRSIPHLPPSKNIRLKTSMSKIT